MNDQQVPSRTSQVGQPEPDHQLWGLILRSIMAQLDVAELALDDPKQVLDPAANGRLDMPDLLDQRTRYHAD